MSKKPRFSGMLLSLVIVSTVSAAFGGVARGTFEKTLTVSGTVDLEVSTGSGDIRVVQGKSGSVWIKGQIQARDQGGKTGEEKVRYLQANPPIVQSGNVIRIGRIEDRSYEQNVSISYELEIPAETRLNSRTGSGNMSVNGVRGPIEASTGSGLISVSKAADQVRAKTGSGDIEISSVAGSVIASSGSGAIRANDIGGSFKGETGSGDIKASLSAPGDAEISSGSGTLALTGVRGSLHAHTGSGSISADGEPKGEWKIGTSSGSVTLRFGSSAAFDLAAHTSSGSIDLNHPVTVMGKISKKEIRGKVRGGGALIEVSTSSGDIRIQ